jgi:hypothetical protein
MWFTSSHQRAPSPSEHAPAVLGKGPLANSLLLNAEFSFALAPTDRTNC